jgi:phytoene dehydrogenase-like protein
MVKRDYDAIVVGSGPNGLAAGIVMQKAGLNVLIIEGKDTVGGGLRTKELTLPGFRHDVCSAIHPLAAASPYFSKLPLDKHGLEYIYPAYSAAHPFDNGKAALLTSSLDETAELLGKDSGNYRNLVESLVKDWPHIAADALGPLTFPSSPVAMAKFGFNAIRSAHCISKGFNTEEGRGLWAGMAAHSIQPLSYPASSAIGLVLMATSHIGGWPIPKGGSQMIANALASYFTSIGGKIETNFYVTSLDQLPSSHAVLFDITPRQLLQIAGHKMSSLYSWQLKRFRYGMGVFKIDWALDAPVPFTAQECNKAGTVHIGNTFSEIALSEKMSWNGQHSDTPFVLLAQQSQFDKSRAPEGKHTLWGYCHVPGKSQKDMTGVIEKQIERFAPGFRDRIIGRHVMSSTDMEDYNPNYIGGDINGGALDIRQLFTRPALRWSPYRTSAKGLYLCSASTPPGGGVHGMCGYYAAKTALKDIFRLKAENL